MSCRKFVIALVIVCIVAVVVAVPSVLLTQKKKTKRNIVLSNKPVPISNKTTVYSKELSVASLVNEWQDADDWNIIDSTYGNKLINLINDTLEAKYQRRSFAPSGQVKGGFQFYASPSPIFPTRNIIFSYQVYVPKRFNWVKGGKLPGVWFGEIGANGGVHDVDKSSFRVMWRINGTLEAYLYIPNNQDVSFQNQSGLVINKEFGTSLWRGMFRLKPGSWNNIKISASMNNDNNIFDGSIGMAVNNVSLSFNKINWGVSNLNIEGLMMHTFFGGSDATWATPVNQYLYFKNFIVQTSK